MLILSMATVIGRCIHALALKIARTEPFAHHAGETLELSCWAHAVVGVVDAQLLGPINEVVRAVPPVKAEEATAVAARTKAVGHLAASPRAVWYPTHHAIAAAVHAQPLAEASASP